jgi:hypothetical protein
MIQPISGVMKMRLNFKSQLRILLPVCFIFLFLLSPVQGIGQSLSLDDSLRQNSLQIVKLMRENKYDESIVLINQTLKIKEDPILYYYLCHIYHVQNEWTEAIKYGKKAIEMNPNLGSAYAELFDAYVRDEDWKQAEAISGKVKEIYKNGEFSEQLSDVDNGLKGQSQSYFFVMLFMLIISSIFFLPIYQASKKKTNFFIYTNSLRFSEILLISVSIICLLYKTFFFFSHYIWSLNQHVSPNDVAFNMRSSVFQHDGAESFILYFLCFVSIISTLLLCSLIPKLRANKNLYISVFLFLIFLTGYYLFTIGFIPSLNANENDSILLPLFISILATGVFFLYQKSKLIPRIAIITFAAFASLISLGAVSTPDLKYILDPSLRLLHGFKPNEIYFQYDLFLSYLGLAWMKLNWSIEWFPYLGQISYFLFFIGAFYFAEHFFHTKGLSILFMIALILMRAYSTSYDVPSIFQVTPLRLDLWIILLLAANKKGINHWLLGTFLGLLVLFHRNLGLIYLAAYLELLVLLFTLDIIPLIQKENFNVKSFFSLFIKHLKLNAVNLVIVIASIGLCFLLFKELFSPSAMIYSKIGVGMLRISRFSFYWYVPVVLSCLTVLSFYFKSKLGREYISVTLFIVLLTVGSSMYFFGRSHENNILNISGILIFGVFVLIDILIFLAPENEITLKKNDIQKDRNIKNNVHQVKHSFDITKQVYYSLPVLFIFLITFFYSDKINDKVKTQYESLSESNFYEPFKFPYMDENAIKAITKGSSKVYFLEPDYDFYFYYYGNYTPLGYYSPMGAWLYKNDMLKFVQGLLDQGYYIVYFFQNNYVRNEYVAYLDFNTSITKNNFTSIYKEDVANLLPENMSTIFNISIKDTIPGKGLFHSGIQLIDSFTIEAIIKPFQGQVSNAAIISSMARIEELEGFTLQYNNNNLKKYVFGFCNGTSSIPNALFDLEDNKWHYIAITVNRSSINVFDNGTLLTSANSGGKPIINSDIPLTIGNNNDGNAHFNGYIREVKISNGIIDESTITNTGQQLNKQLNEKVDNSQK